MVEWYQGWLDISSHFCTNAVITDGGLRFQKKRTHTAVFCTCEISQFSSSSTNSPLLVFYDKDKSSQCPLDRGGGRKGGREGECFVARREKRVDKYSTATGRGSFLSLTIKERDGGALFLSLSFSLSLSLSVSLSLCLSLSLSVSLSLFFYCPCFAPCNFCFKGKRKSVQSKILFKDVTLWLQVAVSCCLGNKMKKSMLVS